MSKSRYLLVRIVSSRGTDVSKCIRVEDESMTDKEVADWWADDYIRGTAIDSCTVHYRRIDLPTKRQLLSKWKKVCKEYDKVRLERDEIRAMLTARQ